MGQNPKIYQSKFSFTFFHILKQTVTKTYLTFSLPVFIAFQ